MIMSPTLIVADVSGPFQRCNRHAQAYYTVEGNLVPSWYIYQFTTEVLGSFTWLPSRYLLQPRLGLTIPACTFMRPSLTVKLQITLVVSGIYSCPLSNNQVFFKIFDY